MMSERDEKLIQRCVDNECSVAERRALMQRMESVPDGWRTIACAFMEEQLFQRSCGDRNETVAGAPLSRPEKQQGSRHWFHHPATSMVLSACVLVLVGVIFVGEFASPDATDSNTADNGRSSSVPSSEPIQQAAVVSSGQPGRVLLESNGMTTQELPLYTDPMQFVSGLRQMRQQSYQLARDLMPSQNLRPEIRYLNIQLDNGQNVVVPIEEILIRHQFQ